jgi:hypothetical protein
LEEFNVIGRFRDVEDIFRDQFNRRVDSNDCSCIYLGNAIPSIFAASFAVTPFIGVDAPQGFFVAASFYDRNSSSPLQKVPVATLGLEM